MQMRRYVRRKFRNLTSDCTESRRQVLQHRCLTAEIFYSTDATWEILAGRNCPKCCVFPYSCGLEASQSQLQKARWWCRGSTAQDVSENCTTLWHESDSEVKIADWHKTGMVGAVFEGEPRKNCISANAVWKWKWIKTNSVEALLEVELCKVCTTLWRESDLEAKIVKNCRSRNVFGRSKFLLFLLPLPFGQGDPVS